MDYATKLLNNVSRTTATPTTPTITTAKHLQLSKQLTSINATVKKMLAKTLVEAKTNISSYTEVYALPSDEIGLITSVSSDDYSLSSIQSSRQEQSAFPAQTVATYVINNKRPTIIIYPTVSPESIVIPIVSCIFGFPLLALLVICCLRRRAKLARERDRRRNYDMQDHTVSLVRFSPIHRLNYRSSRAISLRPERSLSRGFPSLELDTVVEERSDVEQTQTEILTADSPLDSTSFKASFSS